MTKGFSEEEWRESAEGSPSFHFQKGTGTKKPSYDPENSEPDDEMDASTREWRAAEPPPLRDDQKRQGKGTHSRGFKNEARNPDYSESEEWADSDDQEERQWAMMAHGAGAVATLFSVGTLGWAAPLVIWLIRKDQNDFAASQAKEALNFQITMFIYTVIAGILCIILIGIPMLIVLWIVNLIWSIQGAMQTYRGESYDYPWNMRLL